MAEKNVTGLKPNQVKLSDGRIVEIDLYKITRRDMAEWAKLNPVLNPAEYDEWLGKASSLSSDDLASLPIPDWQRIDQAVARLLKEPLDPN